jgi:hypothetical protein
MLKKITDNGTQKRMRKLNLKKIRVKISGVVLFLKGVGVTGDHLQKINQVHRKNNALGSYNK